MFRENPAGPASGAYSRFVKTMRVLLPLAALGIFAVLLAWPELDRKMMPVMQATQDVTEKDIKNELVNPRFEGRDNRQQPYTITATRAAQSGENTDIINLNEPVADITLNSGHWVAAKANNGTYRQEAHKLELDGNVFLFYDGLYEMTTERLHVDMLAQQAWSDVAVKGRGPKGSIEAESVRADLAQNTLLFDGPARLVLNSRISGL